jgi:hypothetical protein
MGFRVVVMFIDSFVHGFPYVRHAEVCKYSICSGAFAMAIRIFNWDVCMTMLDLLA